MAPLYVFWAFAAILFFCFNRGSDRNTIWRQRTTR